MTPIVRSGYSFRHAAGKLEDVADRLKELGYLKAPLTDRASTFGWYRWAKACRERGMEPVFGVELAVTDSLHEKKPSFDHWTFVAKGSVEPLNHLVALATEQFRYRPLLRVDQALAVVGEVSIITGPAVGLPLDSPVAGVHIGIGPSTPKFVARMALENGWDIAAVSDNVFTRKGDDQFYSILVGRNASEQTYPQHILSEDEWASEAERLGLGEEGRERALRASSSILGGCSATLSKASLPHFEADQTLREQCEDGARALGVDLSYPVYAERLDRELSLIEEKGYEDYFFIVGDLVRWARKEMMVGPARGSSCGSLVCYLLGITTVDPIPFGLIFERFIDINRNDMPDIDIDFSDQERHRVFKYIEGKYGSERVARLGTVAMYQPRSALTEVGTALQIPKWECDAVLESLIERSSGDSRALHTMEDTLRTMGAGKRLLEKYPEVEVVTRFEGHPRHYSQHAAGVVISSEPTAKYVAVDHRTGATMCDKKDAEGGFNLLKIDALGLTQLSIFEDALKMAGLPKDHLETLPLDCPEAFEVLNKGLWSGVFQFMGMALQSITKEITVDSFEDIVSITALGRPGPMASGGTQEWINRKNGVHSVTFPHPVFEPYLKETMGIVIYQEQVMEIGRNVGDLDWGQVTALRKAMSKSLGKEFFDQFGDPWKKGAIAKGVNPEAANKIWDDLCAYGAWSFNKSHSVAYGLISYWCCWLKAHYPVEFAAATLTHAKTTDAQLKILREMKAEGIDYVPVDPALSGEKWTVGLHEGRKKLIGPLSSVKGIGPKLVKSILSARARGEPMPSRAEKLLENPVTNVDSLYPIRDAFDRLIPDREAAGIVTPPTDIIDAQSRDYDQQFLFLCTPTNINPRDENEAVKIAKRGYEIKNGPTQSLNLQLTDDTDTIFGLISRFDYDRMGQQIVDRGRPGKALYAIKGTMRAKSSFRMIMIQRIKYIGDIEK